MNCISCTLSFGQHVICDNTRCSECGARDHGTGATYTNLAFEDGRMYHLFVFDERQVCPNCGHISVKGVIPCKSDGEAEEVAHALELVGVQP